MVNLVSENYDIY